MRKQNRLRTAAALLAAVLLYPGQAMAISAQKAILMDGQTGRVLYEKQADDRSLVASTTKIMTALLVCELCNPLEQIRIPKEAVGVEGSSMYLREGEVLTVQELLYGLMLSSGNDAAVALAIHCSGSIEAFAHAMNAKARALGLRNTHFENPHGLDHDDHYSTARDLAVLAAYAMENPFFAQTVGTRSVTVGERFLTNHNKLLWQVEGAEGIKTGFTRAAGRILVSSAKRQGRRLICVTIDDSNDWVDHKNFYDRGFSAYTSSELVQAGQSLGILSVFGGVEETVEVLSAADFSYAMAAGEQVSFRLSVKEFAYAPVVAGAEAGYAYVCVDGRAVGKVPVVFAKTVEQTKPDNKSIWDKLFGGRL